jgi:hypothetical protein
MSGIEADISGFNDIYAWFDDPVADAWWGVDGTILRKHERERDHYDETLKRLHKTTELKGTMSTTMHCALKQCSNNNIGRVIHVLVFNPSYISTILWLYLLILTEL